MAKSINTGPGSDSGGAAPPTPSSDRGPPPGSDEQADGRSALFEHLARPSDVGSAAAGGDATRLSPASVMGAADGRSLLMENLARATGQLESFFAR